MGLTFCLGYAVSALTESPAWKALQAHHKSASTLRMKDLFAADPGRADRLKLEACGIYVDFSKNIATDETLTLLREPGQGGQAR